MNQEKRKAGKEKLRLPASFSCFPAFLIHPSPHHRGAPLLFAA
jgi:hypothetical protein